MSLVNLARSAAQQGAGFISTNKPTFALAKQEFVNADLGNTFEKDLSTDFTKGAPVVGQP